MESVHLLNLSLSFSIKNKHINFLSFEYHDFYKIILLLESNNPLPCAFQIAGIILIWGLSEDIKGGNNSANGCTCLRRLLAHYSFDHNTELNTQTHKHTKHLSQTLVLSHFCVIPFVLCTYNILYLKAKYWTPCLWPHHLTNSNVEKLETFNPSYHLWHHYIFIL